MTAEARRVVKAVAVAVVVIVVVLAALTVVGFVVPSGGGILQKLPSPSPS